MTHVTATCFAAVMIASLPADARQEVDPADLIPPGNLTYAYTEEKEGFYRLHVSFVIQPASLPAEANPDDIQYEVGAFPYGLVAVSDSDWGQAFDTGIAHHNFVTNDVGWVELDLSAALVESQAAYVRVAVRTKHVTQILYPCTLLG